MNHCLSKYALSLSLHRKGLWEFRGGFNVIPACIIAYSSVHCYNGVNFNSIWSLLQTNHKYDLFSFEWIFVSTTTVIQKVEVASYKLLIHSSLQKEFWMESHRTVCQPYQNSYPLSKQTPWKWCQQCWCWNYNDSTSGRSYPLYTGMHYFYISNMFLS